MDDTQLQQSPELFAAHFTPKEVAHLHHVERPSTPSNMTAQADESLESQKHTTSQDGHRCGRDLMLYEIEGELRLLCRSCSNALSVVPAVTSASQRHEQQDPATRTPPSSVQGNAYAWVLGGPSSIIASEDDGQVSNINILASS
jgi:hypothetical protein